MGILNPILANITLVVGIVATVIVVTILIKITKDLF